MKKKNIKIFILFIFLILCTFIFFVFQYLSISHKIPQHSPDKLVITRPEDKLDNLSAFSRTFTDQEKIKQLYTEINALPASHRSGSCPIANFSEYRMDFYEDNTLVLHAVLKPTGCRSVKINNKEIKDALFGDGGLMIDHVKEILGLSNGDFYGHQNGRPLD